MGEAIASAGWMSSSLSVHVAVGTAASRSILCSASQMPCIPSNELLAAGMRPARTHAVPARPARPHHAPPCPMRTRARHTALVRVSARSTRTRQEEGSVEVPDLLALAAFNSSLHPGHSHLHCCAAVRRPKPAETTLDGAIGRRENRSHPVACAEMYHVYYYFYYT